MITGIIHQGSGLGNQLHRYIATRVLAKDKGTDFSMIGGNLFKGASFMNLDMGKPNKIPYLVESGSGRVVPVDHDVWQEKTTYYNPEFNFVESGIIDGEFQDERYFEHRLGEIDEWLGVEPLEMDENLCIIGFRGGEFALYPDLFLPIKYWTDAVDKMLAINPNMKFRIVTDDPKLAKTIFPFEVTHEIGMDWRQCRYAKYAIISNSSFYILPRLLSNGITIAPRYWARRNVKQWSMPQNYYKAFTYI